MKSERDTEIEAKEIFRGESDEEKAGKRQRERWKETEINRERDEKIEEKETERKLEIDGEKAGKRWRESGKETERKQDRDGEKARKLTRRQTRKIHRDRGKSYRDIERVKRRKGRNKNVAEIERKHRDIR